MILHTFSILNGIGQARERRLWQEGILTWDDFLEAASPAGIPPAGKALHDRKVSEARERLTQGDAPYFAGLMPRTEHWRLFEHFGPDAVCLDIESNGLPAGAGGYTTVVGLYGVEGFTALVRGRGLSAEALNSALQGKKLLITFFGSSFDIPFLERTIEGFRLDMPHFDLCFGLRRLGLKGGLKKIEPHFGIHRSSELEGLDGYAAVLLWNRAKRGDEQAMDLLISYNRDDTVNLWKIAGRTFGMLRDSTGIGEYL